MSTCPTTRITTHIYSRLEVDENISVSIHESLRAVRVPRCDLPPGSYGKEDTIAYSVANGCICVEVVPALLLGVSLGHQSSFEPSYECIGFFVVAGAEGLATREKTAPTHSNVSTAKALDIFPATVQNGRLTQKLETSNDENLQPDETSVDALRPGMSLNFSIIAAAPGEDDRTTGSDAEWNTINSGA